MKYLLDTSVFLLSRAAPERLSEKGKRILTSSAAELYLSAASSWEIAIKYATGALRLPKPPSQFVPEALRSWAIQSVDVTHAHALVAGELPMHHRDPFDRLLIAQARVEVLNVLTVDRTFRKYEVEWTYCGR